MFKILVHASVKDEMLTLSASAQAKMIGKIEKLRRHPTALREPDSKPLPHGLLDVNYLGRFASTTLTALVLLFN